MRSGLGNTALLLSNGADKPQAPARQRLDQPLPFAVSPIALLAALMRLNNADSEMARPCQTDAKRSSLLTTRSRCRIK